MDGFYSHILAFMVDVSIKWIQVTTFWEAWALQGKNPAEIVSMELRKESAAASNRLASGAMMRAAAGNSRLLHGASADGTGLALPPEDPELAAEAARTTVEVHEVEESGAAMTDGQAQNPFRGVENASQIGLGQ